MLNYTRYRATRLWNFVFGLTFSLLGCEGSHQTPPAKTTSPDKKESAFFDLEHEINEADKHFLRGDFPEAFDAFEKLSPKAPDDIYVWSGYAQAAWHGKKPNDVCLKIITTGIERYKSLKEKRPRDRLGVVTLLELRAFVYLNGNQLEDAYKTAEEMIQANAKDYRGHKMAAIAAVRMHDVDIAKWHVDSAIKLGGKHDAAVMDLADRLRGT